MGICYQTVSNANHNLSPTPRVYEHKLKECHKIFIHIKTLFDPHLSGEKLAKMIYDEFGLEVNSRTVNRCRNEMKMQYRPPICSVFVSPDAALKRKNWTGFHLENENHFMDVAFSDESWFQIDRNNRWFWVDKENLTDRMYSKRKAHLRKSWFGAHRMELQKWINHLWKKCQHWVLYRQNYFRK